MSWLTNLIPPKIRAAFVKKEVPDQLWYKCLSCEQMVFHKEFVKNLKVCPHCNYHARISAKERLDMLFDTNDYHIIKPSKVAVDPLKFRDTKKYTERLKAAKTKAGTEDAITIGSGSVNGVECVIAAFDFGFIGGSMGVYVGEAILKGAEYAVQKGLPYVVIPASGGARMQEAILSLMQMARTTLASQLVKEAGLPFITVLTDPTTGGVSASFASLGDVIMAESGAIIGFTGARVIEQTIKQKLPEGFQRAEYLYEHGMLDMVVHRHELQSTLARTVSLLTKQPLKA